MEKIDKFIDKVEKKFDKYFVAYGISKQGAKYIINIIIKDSDVLNMDKNDLISKIDAILNKFSKETSAKIKPKTILTSDLNENIIWEVLGDKSTILNVKLLTSFFSLQKLPKKFFEAYEKLPIKFKLSDIARETSLVLKKEFHRNTYQNWLKSLESAGFLKLKNRTYYKIEGKYRQELIDNLSK